MTAADPVPSNRDSPTGRVALIGPGRAGLAVASALVAAGWRVVAVAGRAPDAPSVIAASGRFAAAACRPAEAAAAAELVVIATPDDAIGAVARAIAGSVAPNALVIHLSGAHGLGVLAELPSRIGALHPLQTMPNPERGAARFAGAGAAVAGDPAVAELARALGMLPFTVADADRVAYHAAACIASNHLAALLASVEACTDVELAVFLPLVRATIDHVAELGPRGALTGPVARGDVATVRAHLGAIPVAERAAYQALAGRAAVLADRQDQFADVLT